MVDEEYFRLRQKAFALLEKTTEGYVSKASAIPNQPTWIHPWSVHLRLIAHGVTDREVLLAAILHDVVEDSNTTLEYVAREFTPRVAELVDLVSKSKQVLSEEEEAEFYERLLTSNDVEAITLKVFDRIDNILTDWTFKSDAERVRSYINNTKRYYPALAGQVGLTDELNNAVQYIESYHRSLF